MKQIGINWLYKYGYLPWGKLGGFNRGSIKWTDKWSSRESSLGFYLSTYEDNMYFNPVYALVGEYGEKEMLDYKIPLTTSRCNYGGKRYWFICPMICNGIRCMKRVGVLYMGSKYFACRHCSNMTYSRNETRSQRWQSVDKRWKLEYKLEDLEMLTSKKQRWYGAKLTKYYVELNYLRKILYGYDEWSY